MYYIRMYIETIKMPKFPIGMKKPKVIDDPSRQRNRFGRMVYGHKTAGEINIMTREQFDDFKSYEPAHGGRSSVKTQSKTTGGSSGGLGGI